MSFESVTEHDAQIASTPSAWESRFPEKSINFQHPSIKTQTKPICDLHIVVTHPPPIPPTHTEV